MLGADVASSRTKDEAGTVKFAGVVLAAVVLTYVRVAVVRSAASRALAKERVTVAVLRVPPIQLTPTPYADFSGQRGGHAVSGRVIVGRFPIGPPLNTAARIVWNES